MVYECGYSSTAVSCEVDPQTRKSAFKTLDMETYGVGGEASTGAKPKKIKGSNSNEQDAWGPIFKNKEHFVNMHIC